MRWDPFDPATAVPSLSVTVTIGGDVVQLPTVPLLLRSDRVMAKSGAGGAIRLTVVVLQPALTCVCSPRRCGVLHVSCVHVGVWSGPASQLACEGSVHGIYTDKTHTCTTLSALTSMCVQLAYGVAAGSGSQSSSSDGAWTLAATAGRGGGCDPVTQWAIGQYAQGEGMPSLDTSPH